MVKFKGIKIIKPYKKKDGTLVKGHFRKLKEVEMKNEVEEIFRKHWGVIKQMYPDDKKVIKINDVVRINPEYASWLHTMRNQIFELVNEISKLK
jgi:IS1 family transposase